MKTLHFEVFDQAGEPTPATLTVAYSWDVLMDDGTVFSSEPRRYSSATGVFDVEVLASNDPGIKDGYEAFTMTVSWAAIVPDCNGRMSTGKANTRTVQVVMADPEPFDLADLANVTPARMDGVWYGSGGGGGGGVTDHGQLSGLGDDDHTQYALANGSRGAFAAPLGADDNYVTDAEKTKLSNLSGTNTGDQDLSGLVPNTRTVAGKALSANVTLAAADVGAVPTSRTIGAGTGLTGGGDLSANRTLAVNFGTAAGTVAQGNDSRLSNSRTPTAHKSSHATGGGDALTPADIGAVPTSRTVAGKALTGNITIGAADLSATGTRDGTTVLHGDNTWKVPAGGGGGGSTPDVRFEATSSTTSGTFQEVPNGSFQAVTLGAAQGEIVTNVGGGTVDTTTWTVPVSGVYLLAGTLRIADSSVARSTYFNMHTTTADHPSGLWQSFGGTGAGMRHVISHTRITTLNQGDQVRLVTYSDQTAMNLIAASLSVILIREA